MKRALGTIVVALALIGCTDPGAGHKSQEAPASQASQPEAPAEEKPMTEPAAPDTAKVIKSEDQWRKQLSPLEYKVLREKGTERAFTGEYWDEKRTGTYVCRGCDLPLFSSDTKFKSGTGWPSFYQPIAEGRVAEESDSSYGMVRTEVLCERCDGHLGHVFSDGPKPTNLRYCINSASIKLQPEE